METLTISETESFLEISWWDSSDTLHSFIFLKNMKSGSYVRTPYDLRTETIAF